MAGLPMILAGGFLDLLRREPATSDGARLVRTGRAHLRGLAARLAGPRWAPLASSALAIALPMQFTSLSTKAIRPRPFLPLGLCLVPDSLRAGGRASGSSPRWAGWPLGMTLLFPSTGPSDILPSPLHRLSCSQPAVPSPAAARGLAVRRY